MHRYICLSMLLAAVAIAPLAAAAGRPAPASPAAPSFTATLTDDGACLLTLTATWKNAKVDQVFAFWYEDDPTLSSSWATREAPGTGPNGGTLRGKKAVMQVGPLNSTDVPHTHQVRVQFYYQGAQVQQEFSNVDTVNCSI